MWLELVAVFLGASILLYCLFAGADFGAGILEIFTFGERREDQRELVTHAMGPVWEANHVWLVIGVVILFNGFPAAFEALSVYLHLPLVVLLLAIVLRGSAFTFRHYDAVKDESQKYYDVAFAASSLVASIMLGTIAGAMMVGRIDPQAATYPARYVSPWLNPFCLSVGLFTASLFAFLAATYLIGESEDEGLKRIFSRRAKAANLAAVVSGALVFLSARGEAFPLLESFLSDAWCVTAIGLATILLVPLWWALGKSWVVTSRLLAGGQVALILAGWLKIRFPVILAVRGNDLDIWSTAAPTPALRYLGLALLFGSALIFPCLIFLLRVFKQSQTHSSK